MSVIFSSKIKQGHQLHLTYLYACGIMQLRDHCQISKWIAQGGQERLEYRRGLEPSMLPW